jgi:uncharacterized membrane protein YidH (DUF202 family)
MTGRGPDRGLSAERTQLAWSRSALSLLACGAAAIKGVPKVTSGHPLTGIVLLMLGGLVWLAGVPLARARAAHPDARPAARQHELAIVAVGSAMVGAAAFVIAVFFPG